MQIRVVNELRNRINADYVNSKKDSKTIKDLEKQLDEMAKSTNEKDLKIQVLVKVSQFSDIEKRLFDRALDDGDTIDTNMLSEEEQKVCKGLYEKGVWGKSGNNYNITNMEYRKYGRPVLSFGEEIS